MVFLDWRCQMFAATLNIFDKNSPIASSIHNDALLFLGGQSAFCGLNVDPDGYDFLRERPIIIQRAVKEHFSGYSNVLTLEEIQQPKNWEYILLWWSHIYMDLCPQGKYDIKVDADSTVRCESSQLCNRIFVPFFWRERDYKNQ